MKKITLRLIETNPDPVITLLRVTLAAIMFAHGAQKMLGWFGGHGPLWTVEMWTKWFGFPSSITWLVILGEFFGPILLLVGFFTRMFATVMALILIGAVYFVHGKWGFYMNWYSEQGRGEGFEYHILALVICLVLAWRGSGAASIDTLLYKQSS